MSFILIVMLMAAVCEHECAAQEVLASAPDTSTIGGENWAKLSATQQKVLTALKDIWNELPGPVQQHMGRVASHFDALTAEQRADFNRRTEQWLALTSEQRAEMRQRYLNFQQMPPEQRQRLRQLSQYFDQLPAAQRSELRRRFEDMSPVQQRSYMNNRRMHPPLLTPDERSAMRAMIGQLNSEQRMVLHQRLQHLPALRRI